MVQIPGAIREATGGEFTINQLGEIEERKDAGRAWAKIDQYTAYAPRGFRSFGVSVGRGLYGIELAKSLRGQVNARRHSLWELKIRDPLTNRLINGIVLASWGADDGRVGRMGSIFLNDCYPLGSGAFDKYKPIGDKMDDRDGPPSPIYMCVEMARWQSRLFSAAYGEEHLDDRAQSIERLNDIHEDCRELRTATSIDEKWARMPYQYNIPPHGWYTL